jgi:hypothetical protein
MDAEKCENAKMLLRHAMQITKAIAERLPPECAEPLFNCIQQDISQRRAALIVPEECPCELLYFSRDQV